MYAGHEGTDAIVTRTGILFEAKVLYPTSRELVLRLNIGRRSVVRSCQKSGSLTGSPLPEEVLLKSGKSPHALLLYGSDISPMLCEM